MATEFGAQPRPYGDDERDFPKLQQFIDEAWKAVAPDPWEFHRGDLTWQRFLLDDALSRWPESVTLWERADGWLAGFSIYNRRHRELILLPRPGLDENASFVSAMLAAAREIDAALAANDKPLLVSALEGTPLHRTLLELGLQTDPEMTLRLNWRELDTVPVPVLPEGWKVRSLLGPEEYQQRVDLHREAFHPSQVTLSAYERLRAAPGYDPELDLVAVSPSGEFASYAIAWFDPISLIGEFEPVGAAVAFRGRGLTKAVLQEGMRRLRERGATSAIVYCEPSSPAACGLYESVGFRERTRWVYLRMD